MEIELPDGTILDAPDDADVKTVVQGYMRSRGTVPEVPSQAAPVAAPRAATAPEKGFMEKGREFNDQMRSAFIRPVVQGLTFLPGMAADATMAAWNLATGQRNQLPTQARDAVLDQFTRKPEGVGKIAEAISSGIVGGALPTGFVSKAAAEVVTPEKAAGYVTPEANAGISKSLLQGFAGKKSVEQGAAIVNQKTTNSLARKALGMADDEPLTIPALKALRDKAGNAYERVAKAGAVVPDEQFIDDLAQIDEGATAILKDFPDAAPVASDGIRKLVTSLLRDKFDSRSALAYLKELRADAAANLKFQNSADPAKRTLGMAQREAASTLEEMLERHLIKTGQQEAAAEFKAARELIAKTYAVQGALNESTNNVVATALGGQLKRGKMLTGELETIARFGRAFPKAAREVTEVFPGVSPWDFAFSTTAGLATGSPLPALYPFARIAARKALLSKYGQNMGRPVSTGTFSGVAAGVEDAARQ